MSGRSLLTLAAFSLACCCLAQSDRSDMAAFIGGKPAGTAVVTRVITLTRVTTRSSLTLTQGGSMTLDVEVTSDTKGNAIKKVMTIARVGRRDVLTVTYAPKSATVVSNTGQKKTVPMAGRTPRTDVTDLWFVKVQPKPGQKTAYQSFDPLSATWSVIRTTYIGKRAIKINGQSVQAHMLTQVRDKVTATLYLDNRGMPLRTEEPQLVLVRK